MAQEAEPTSRETETVIGSLEAAEMMGHLRSRLIHDGSGYY
jgi:hypothetical protein